MKTLVYTLCLLCLQLIAGSCSPTTEKGSEPGRTMNGTYIDDSASSKQDIHDTISRNINNDWNREK